MEHERFTFLFFLLFLALHMESLQKSLKQTSKNQLHSLFVFLFEKGTFSNHEHDLAILSSMLTHS